MNGAELGAKCFVSAGNSVHAVVPGPCQSNAAPPHSCTSMPRCFLYQAPRVFGSLDLKKTPPMPVTRFMTDPRGEKGGRACGMTRSRLKCVTACGSDSVGGAPATRPAAREPRRKAEAARDI